MRLVFHWPKHLYLVIGRADSRKKFTYRQFGSKPLRRRLLTLQNFRGNVNTAGEH